MLFFIYSQQCSLSKNITTDKVCIILYPFQAIMSICSEAPVQNNFLRVFISCLKRRKKSRFLQKVALGLKY